MNTIEDAPEEFKMKLAELNEDGGGWVNQGPKAGYYADTFCATQWPMRCKSRCAYGCMTTVKYQYH
jgi:hypothetical protein